MDSMTLHDWLTHPATLTAASWVVSRLQILFEVRAKAPGFRLTRYLAHRWRQILSSAVSSVGAYFLLTATGSLDPVNAILAGAASDQIIDRFAGVLARNKRPDVPPGEAEGDVTTIVQ